MNVQELIDQLQQVKDKSKDVVCPKGYLVECIFLDENGDVKIIIDA